MRGYPARMCALRFISRMSVPSASDRPAPTATPLMPPTIGFSQRCRRVSRNCETQPRSSSCVFWGVFGL